MSGKSLGPQPEASFWRVGGMLLVLVVPCHIGHDCIHAVALDCTLCTPGILNLIGERRKARRGKLAQVLAGPVLSDVPLLVPHQ